MFQHELRDPQIHKMGHQQLKALPAAAVTRTALRFALETTVAHIRYVCVRTDSSIAAIRWVMVR